MIHCFCYIIVLLLLLPTTFLPKSKLRIKYQKITLKVLLVEFNDVKHRNPKYPANLSLAAYTYDDFNNMLFSVDKYFSPSMYSPDSDLVFGSLRDYYRVMSNNNFDIDGFILNHDSDDDNIPDWILLENDKQEYDKDGRRFRRESISNANLQGLNVQTNDSTFLLIIYAGHTYRSGQNTLTPEANIKSHEYIMGERFIAGSPYREERDNPKEGGISRFAQIGIHVHEFGHLIGFEDHDGGKCNEFWCIMSKGCYNGPKFEGACPAPINPYLRYKMGWIKIDSIGINSIVNLEYDIRTPKIYKIQDDKSKCYFLVEFRKFNAQMKLGNEFSKDYNSFLRNVTYNNGILVWRKLVGDFVKLIYSGGENCAVGDLHLFPGRCNINVLTPWSENRPRDMGYYWVPNTKPSLNCGLEIISVKNDFASVYFYQKDPWLSSPSRPKEMSIVNNENDVSIKWENNTEPDLNYYRVYKKQDKSEYELYDSCYSNVYTDHEEIIDTSSIDNIFIYYMITTVDSSNKESTYSDEIKIGVKSNYTSCFNEEKNNLPQFYLHQNYPNPFNQNTIIHYSIPQMPNTNSITKREDFVLKANLTIYDLLGNEIKVLVDERKSAGQYEVELKGSELASGIYLCRLQVYAPGSAGNFVETKKMVLLK